MPIASIVFVEGLLLF